MRRVTGETSADRNGPHTRAIDIGGTGVKTFVLDSTGRMMMRHLADAVTFSNDENGFAEAVECPIVPRSGNGSAVV